MGLTLFLRFGVMYRICSVSSARHCIFLAHPRRCVSRVWNSRVSIDNIHRMTLPDIVREAPQVRDEYLKFALARRTVDLIRDDPDTVNQVLFYQLGDTLKSPYLLKNACVHYLSARNEPDISETQKQAIFNILDAYPEILQWCTGFPPWFINRLHLGLEPTTPKTLKEKYAHLVLSTPLISSSDPKLKSKAIQNANPQWILNHLSSPSSTSANLEETTKLLNEMLNFHPELKNQLVDVLLLGKKKVTAPGIEPGTSQFTITPNLLYHAILALPQSSTESIQLAISNCTQAYAAVPATLAPTVQNLYFQPLKLALKLALSHNIINNDTQKLTEIYTRWTSIAASALAEDFQLLARAVVATGLDSRACLAAALIRRMGEIEQKKLLDLTFESLVNDQELMVDFLATLVKHRALMAESSLDGFIKNYHKGGRDRGSNRPGFVHRILTVAGYEHLIPSTSWGDTKKAAQAERLKARLGKDIDGIWKTALAELKGILPKGVVLRVVPKRVLDHIFDAELCFHQDDGRRLLMDFRPAEADWLERAEFQAVKRDFTHRYANGGEDSYSGYVHVTERDRRKGESGLDTLVKLVGEELGEADWLSPKNRVVEGKSDRNKSRGKRKKRNK